jgi:hypothetical protein
MVYRFWMWYDSLIGRKGNLRFLIFIVTVAPFIIGIGYPRGSTPMILGLGWVTFLVITRMYVSLRSRMDKEVLEEHGRRHSRK